MLMPCLFCQPTGRHPSLTHTIWVPRMLAMDRSFRTKSTIGGLLAGRVALEPGYGLSFSEDALVEYRLPAKIAHTVLARFYTLSRWAAVNSSMRVTAHGIERGRTDLRAWTGLPACVINVRTM